MNGLSWQPKPTLFYLAALCAALSFPVLAIAAFMTWQYADAETRYLKDRLNDINTSIRHAVERLHDSDVAALRALATSPTIQDGDFGSFRMQASEFATAHMPGGRIVLRALNGRILADSAPPKKPAAALLPVEPAAPSQRYSISNLVAGKSYADSGYQIAIPVHVGGTVAYDLTAWVPLARLARLIKEQNLKPEHFAVIVDSNGLIIARSHDSEKYYGKAAAGVEANPTADSFEWSGVNSQGVRIFATFRRTDSTRWGTAVGISQRALYAPLYRSLIWLVLMAGSMLISGCSLAWWLTAILSRSTDKLVAAARELGDGEVILPPATPIREINVIASAIGAASGTLRRQAEAMLRAKSELEKEVAERTRELVDKTQLLETTLAHMDQGLLVIDQDKHIQLYNSRVVELTGVPDAVLETFPSIPDFIESLKTQSALVEPPDNLQTLLTETLKPGETIVNEIEKTDGTFIETRTVPLDDGRIVCTYTDVTERRRAERRLEHSTEHDPLTGLPNRGLLRKRLKQAMAPAAANEAAFALYLMHLDGLRKANDDYGYAAGDALLVAFTGKLKSALDVGSMAARLDGSVFAVVQPVTDRGRNIAAQIQRLIRDLPGQYVTDGGRLDARVSIGIAMYPAHGRTIDALKRNADTALDEARRGNGNHYRIYNNTNPMQRAG